MKKIILTSIVILFGCFAIASDSTFTINGEFKKVKKGLAYLRIITPKKGWIDSAVIKDGKFKFIGKISEIANGILFLKKPVRSSTDENYFTFFIEPKVLAIEGFGDSLPLLTIKGSQLNDDDKVLK